MPGSDKGKKAGSGKKRPSPKKTNSTRGRAGKTSAARIGTVTPHASGGRNAIAALAILGLGTAVVVLATNLYFSGKPGNRKPASLKNIMNKDNAERKEVSVREEPGQGKIDKDHDKKTGEKLIPEKEIKIYLVHFNEKTEKMSLRAVNRRIKAEDQVQAALEELVKGPTAQDKKRGLLTAIPADVKIRSVAVRNGVAVINFNEAVEKNANGTIILSRVDQIVYTATQFPGVRGIIIQINGKTRTTIGSDGLSLSNPVTRQRH